jgi:hypothetical protein
MGFGLSFKQDRCWKITIGDKDYFLREYNDEITGYDDELHVIAPDIIHYGGNAYYATGKFAEQNGWLVTEVPRENHPHP